MLSSYPSHCLLIILHVDPPVILHVLSIVSHWLLIILHVILFSFPRFPPWSPCSSMFSSLLLIVFSCFSHILPTFAPWSHCPPCYPPYDFMFLPCWSWWWSWLNLHDDVLPCYHLLADDVLCLFYLFDLIIVVDCWLFLSQISCYDDLYFSHFSLLYIENMF